MLPQTSSLRHSFSRLRLLFNVCLFCITATHSLRISVTNNNDIIDLGAKYGLDMNSISSRQIPHETLMRILKGSESGNMDNIYFLGLLKMYGISVSKDETAAYQNFVKAAHLGNPDAATAAAVCLMRGIGVDSDPSAAFIWYEN